MSYRPAIPTMSLGHGAAGHSMRTKLEAAKSAGFVGIEVFYACLESFSRTLEGATPRDKLREAARATAAIAKELGLELFVLQPLLNYDGIKDPREHAERVEEAVFRFELCHLLGVGMMQVPANFRLDDGISGEEDKIVADLRELADLGAKESPPIRFVYEAMSWSTHNPTWQQGWNVVQKVNRPNFGIVLDTFHLAGYEYADPTVAGGVRPDGQRRLDASLAELVKTIPGDRVFYVQVVDAERIDPPLAPLGSKEGSASPYYVEGQPPRMSWSRNCRLFPYEVNGEEFMPIEKTLEAFLKTGFKGWISMELFNRSMNDPDPKIPLQTAQRGMISWKKLAERLHL